jgi:iron complex outermembrane recepter protein
MKCMKKLYGWGLVPLFCLIGITLIGQQSSDSLDYLLLNQEVLSEVTIQSKVNISSSITTISNPSSISTHGTADLLSTVSGIFSDGSTGEVFSRVYSRGISLSAEDDIGWYYNSLQEDGMPISAIQYNYFSPDLFHRADVSTSRVEIIKGGKSGILAQNSPGTLVNFISHSPSSAHHNHDKLTMGLHQNGQIYGRIEGYSGGPIGDSPWSFDFGYLYRYDRGNRDIDYSLNDGGQVKAGIYRTFSTGILSMKMKYLNDKTNRYTGVAASNWNNPEPAFGQSFQNTSLLPPSLDGMVPDGRTNGTTSYTYNPANGIQAKEFSTLLHADFSWNGWRVKNNLKLSLKSLDWQTAIGGQPLGLENFISYFVSGDAFPAGIVDFKDVSSGQSLATVNNVGMLNAFQGLPPTFEYISGNLPYDAIMGTGAWKKDDQINEWMNDLRISKEFGKSTLTFGSFYSRSDVEVFTNASFIYSTYEAQPRLLSLELTDFDGNQRSLSTAQGLSNLGGLLYEQADIQVNQWASYAFWNANWTDRLSTDLGFRYESVNHKGNKSNSSPLQRDGGIDGNSSTGYDNGLLVTTSTDPIDYNYDYLSYSLGINYEVSAAVNIYGRYSLTHKAPELNYYINNFSNVPINAKGTVQDINQIEFGLKGISQYNGYSATLFSSQLDHVAYSNFEFDDQTNSIFYTPTQLNSSNTIGLELEYYHKLNSQWTISLSTTLQDAKLDQFSQYNANGSVDSNDDEIVSFDNMALPHQPKFSNLISLQYAGDRFAGSLGWRYLGSRYGNFENSFRLPAYSAFNLNMHYDLSERWYVGIRAQNLLNTAGLNNFFGPNEFGSSANAATADYISGNPNASFVVFPIAGRSVFLSIGYQFEKS